MKIFANQLSTHLQRSAWQPIYWVSGDEPFLLTQTCDLIRTYAKEQNFYQREIHHIDGQFRWQDLRINLQTKSLFAEQTLVELRLEQAKLSSNGQHLLQDYCSNPNPSKLILIISPKLSNSVSKQTWFRQLEKHMGWIPIWPLKPKELPSWIQNRLQQFQLSADQSVIQLLAQQGEGNLLAVSQTIEKLSLLYPQQHLQLEQVETMVTDQAMFDLFALAEAAIGGQLSRALRILAHLHQCGTAAPLILWVLVKEIRLLSQLTEQRANSSSLEQLLQQYQIWPKRQPLLKQALRRRVPWLSLLNQANNIDRAIKGARIGNIWNELEQLLIVMTTERRLSDEQ